MDTEVYYGREQREEPSLTLYRRHFRQCPQQGGGMGECPGWRTGASSAGSPYCTGLCPRWAHRGAGAPSSVEGPAELPSQSRCNWCLSAGSGRCRPCLLWWSQSTTHRWSTEPSWEGRRGWSGLPIFSHSESCHCCDIFTHVVLWHLPQLFHWKIPFYPQNTNKLLMAIN